MSSTRRRGLGRAISRDSITYVGGWYLIIYQAQFAPQFNLTVFIGGIVIALVPGGIAAWALRQASVLTPTAPLSSDSPPGAPSQPSS